jgi:hypothetical protein
MEFRPFRHPVFNAIAAYGASAFVVLQAADLFLPALLFPDWVFRFLVVLALIGLPLTGLIVWFQTRPALATAVPAQARSGWGSRSTRVLVVLVLLLSLAGGGLAFATVKPENIPIEPRDWIVLADCRGEPRNPRLTRP